MSNANNTYKTAAILGEALGIRHTLILRWAHDGRLPHVRESKKKYRFYGEEAIPAVMRILGLDPTTDLEVARRLIADTYGGIADPDRMARIRLASKAGQPTPTAGTKASPESDPQSIAADARPVKSMEFSPGSLAVIKDLTDAIDLLTDEISERRRSRDARVIGSGHLFDGDVPESQSTTGGAQ